MKTLIAAALTAASLFAISAVSVSAHETRDPIMNPIRNVVCTFSGFATTTPNNPNDAGVEAVEDDILEGDEGSPNPELFPGAPAGTAADILLDTDTGGYAFQADGVCVDTGDVTNPIAVKIDSGGTYGNTTCGTGIAWSTVGTATTIKDRDRTTTYFNDIHYKVVFIGGEGELTIYHATDASGPGAGARLTGGGDVHIRPRQDDPTTPENESGGNCTTTDVTVFSVEGMFSMVE